MKPFKIIIPCLLILLGCGSNDDLNCALVDCALDSFQIILVNDAGINLIDNGTFNASEIVVLRDDEVAGTVVESSDSGIESAIWLTLLREGSTEFRIRLSETETDILNLNLFIESTGQCCGPNFSANTATYNNIPQTIQQSFSGFTERIVVVR